MVVNCKLPNAHDSAPGIGNSSNLCISRICLKFLDQWRSIPRDAIKFPLLGDLLECLAFVFGTPRPSTAWCTTYTWNGAGLCALANYIPSLGGCPSFSLSGAHFLTVSSFLAFSLPSLTFPFYILNANLIVLRRQVSRLYRACLCQRRWPASTQMFGTK